MSSNLKKKAEILAIRLGDATLCSIFDQRKLPGKEGEITCETSLCHYPKSTFTGCMPYMSIKSVTRKNIVNLGKKAKILAIRLGDATLCSIFDPPKLPGKKG